jgi:succinate dehydrogenase / fumarate reductase cytochrome b subunit
VHILTTATGVAGQARFERTFAQRTWVTAAIVVLVLIPLAFHAAYGAYLAALRRDDRSLPTWRPKLRRTAAVGTLVFVAAHVVELPAHLWTGRIGTGALFDVVGAHLSSTWHGVPAVAVFYLAGVAATLAHFALELWVFVPASGVVLAEGARKVFAWGLVVGASVLFLVAGNTIVFFATGAPVFGPSAPVFVPEGPPPVPCSPNVAASPRH